MKDVWLIDGALYKGNASHWLSLKPSRFPGITVDHEIDRGAIYCTQNGNTWFGTWLMEDCPTYALACEGVPVTTAPSARYPLFTQGPAYERWLGMQPLRTRGAFSANWCCSTTSATTAAGIRVIAPWVTSCCRMSTLRRTRGVYPAWQRGRLAPHAQ